MKVKIIEVSLHELPRGTTLSEFLEGQVNDFLAKKAGVKIVYTHMNTVVLPPEEGGGQFRDAPASIVVLISIFYTD
jgi:hypothetical protein